MNELALIFLTVSQGFNLPPGLLRAICFVESGHAIHAINVHDGGEDSIGICQVHLSSAQQVRPGTARSDLYDPKINIAVAAAYLDYQFKRYGDWERAVVAYNRGNSAGLTSSQYSRKVLRFWKASQ